MAIAPVEARGDERKGRDDPARWARDRAWCVRTRSIKHRRGEIARWALEGGVRTSLQRRAGASEKALRVRFIPVGVWICRNVGHARQSPSLSANAREVLARRERAEGRVQSFNVRSGRSDRVSGPPRPRIVAATRGDRGAPVRKRNILGQFRNPALWRSGSREPRLHARALGERVIGELTPSRRPIVGISEHRSILEKPIERWRRRGRAR